MLLLRHGPNPGGKPAEDGQGERRVVEDRPLEVPRREGEAARRLDRDDLRDARQAVKHRELAEELARAENRELVTVADDPNRAVNDEEESRPDLALSGNDPVCRKFDLDGAFGDRREVDRGHACEQPTGTEQLGSPVPGERQ
jgi:hypothetical protein